MSTAASRAPSRLRERNVRTAIAAQVVDALSAVHAVVEMQTAEADRTREGDVRCAIWDDGDRQSFTDAPHARMLSVDHPPIVGAGLLALASAGAATAALTHPRTELTP